MKRFILILINIFYGFYAFAAKTKEENAKEGFVTFIGIIVIIGAITYLIIKGVEQWRIKKGLDPDPNVKSNKPTQTTGTETGQTK